MKGLVKVEVVQRIKGKDPLTRKQEGHNLISTGGLSMMGANAVNNMLMNTAKMAGHRVVRNTLNQLKADYYSPYTTFNFSKKETALACALLGVADGVYQNISSLDGFIPVLSSGGSVDANKVRAVANLAEAAAATEGVAEKRNADSFIDFNRCGQRYSFPDGTGTGTVTGVAMLPGSWRPGAVPFGGIMSMMKLEEADGFADSALGATAVIPPGVDGLGLAVGMKYTTADGVVSHVRNLVTGEVTDGSASDWYVEGKHILGDDGTYILYVDPVYQSSYYNTVYRYNKSTGNNEDFLFTGSYSYRAADPIAGMFHDTANSMWYCCVCGDRSSSPTIYMFNSASMQGGYVYTASDKSNIATLIQTQLGITVPADWITDATVTGFIPITVGNYKGLQVRRSYNGMHGTEIYVFSDGSDVIGSLVDIIPCVSPNDAVWSVGANYGILALGYDTYHVNPNRVEISNVNTAGASTTGLNNQDIVYGNTGQLALVSNGTHTFGEYYNWGAYLAVKGMWSTWISLKQLSESVNKTAATKMYVEYDYSFESTGTAAVPAFTGEVSVTRDTSS